jgi:hypothetical protein
MDIASILTDLKAERKHIDQAIAALESLDGTATATPRAFPWERSTKPSASRTSMALRTVPAATLWVAANSLPSGSLRRPAGRGGQFGRQSGPAVSGRAAAARRLAS